MKLWTFQPRELAERLLSGEELVSDPLLAECYNSDESFERSYLWLSGRMEETIPRPSSALIPIWAWHTSYGVQGKPDRRRGMFRSYRKEDVIMELEIPEEFVLLSDFDDWHYVLNNWPLHSPAENEGWPHGYDKWGDPIYDDELKKKSWEKIFRADGKFVQACFWSLKPEYVVKIHKLRRSDEL